MMFHASTVRSDTFAGMVLWGMIGLAGLMGCEPTPPEPIASSESTDLTASPRIEEAELGDTQNVHRFADVWMCSQPSAEALAMLRDQGVKTVINLRHPVETPDFDQRKAVTDLGITYHNPAFRNVDELTDEVLDEAVALLASEADRPIAVYCSSANRVGAIWLAYRVLKDGIPFEDALEEARQVGLRTDAYVERVREYVEKKNAAGN